MSPWGESAWLLRLVIKMVHKYAAREKNWVQFYTVHWFQTSYYPGDSKVNCNVALIFLLNEQPEPACSSQSLRVVIFSGMDAPKMFTFPGISKC